MSELLKTLLEEDENIIGINDITQKILAVLIRLVITWDADFWKKFTRIP